MLRSIDSSLLSRYSSQWPTPARGIRITRKDRVTIGYTSSDRSIRFNGVLYQSNRGLRISRISTSGELATDSLEITGAISNDERSAVIRGLFDGADWVSFDYDWKFPSLPVSNLKSGWCAQGELHGIGFKLELLGKSAALRYNEGRTIGPLCDVARLGGPRCNVDLTPFTDIGQVVTLVQSSTRIAFSGYSPSSPSAGAASGGWIEWTSGANSGQKTDIRQHSTNGLMVLYEPTVYPVFVGDEGTIVQGCDRTIETCASKFNNAVNHQGFTDVTTADEAYGEGRL